MKRLHIATSPLTGTIFVGSVLKNGTWATNKQDITVEALIAVAVHGIRFGKPIELRDGLGNLLYTIIVAENKNATL